MVLAYGFGYNIIFLILAIIGVARAASNKSFSGWFIAGCIIQGIALFGSYNLASTHTTSLAEEQFNCALGVFLALLVIFLAWAYYCKSKAKERAESGSEYPSDRIVYYCKSCGNIWDADKSAVATNCPQCKGAPFRTDVALAAWNCMADGDKEYAKAQWEKGIYYIPKVKIPVTAESGTAGQTVVDTPQTYNPRMVLYCKNCGKIIDVQRSEASKTHVCPSCKNQMLNTGCKLLTWDTSSKAEKNQLKLQWNAMNITAATDTIVTSDAGAVSTQAVCRSCGNPLVAGAKFCRECGTPVEPAVEPELTKVNEEIKEPNRCGKCGNILFEGQKFCNKCGTPVEQFVLPAVIRIPAEEELPATEPAVSDVPTEEAEPDGPKTLDLSSLPAALRRAYIFIEDEEWERAEEYLEKVLDDDPENAYAYLGKAMAAVKVGTPTFPTANEMKELVSRKEYARAKRFADDELSAILSGWEKETES